VFLEDRGGKQQGRGVLNERAVYHQHHSASAVLVVPMAVVIISVLLTLAGRPCREYCRGADKDSSHGTDGDIRRELTHKGP
jgi:hypothetical protein